MSTRPSKEQAREAAERRARDIAAACRRGEQEAPTWNFDEQGERIPPLPWERNRK